MFVIEDGYRKTVLLEDFYDFLEEFVAGIERLAQVVDRVFSVFADQENDVDGQFVTAAA